MHRRDLTEGSLRRGIIKKLIHKACENRQKPFRNDGNNKTNVFFEQTYACIDSILYAVMILNCPSYMLLFTVTIDDIQNNDK